MISRFLEMSVRMDVANYTSDTKRERGDKKICKGTLRDIRIYMKPLNDALCKRFFFSPPLLFFLMLYIINIIKSEL